MSVSNAISTLISFVIVLALSLIFMYSIARDLEHEVEKLKEDVATCKLSQKEEL